MALRALLLLSVFVVSCSSLEHKPQGWKQYYDTEHYRYYYDADTVLLVEDDRYKVTIRLSGSSSVIVSEAEIDCKNIRILLSRHTVYDIDGRILSTKSYDILVWEPIVQNSAAGHLFNSVCK